ncbi:MAG: DNA cytosine methyltransferase [Rhodobacteraceae bacterium]|nr:DNA cytosine methyltransferase [Paracoccaceae bacterium]
MKPLSISLFSGAGGMDIGVARAGFANLCSVEADPYCAATLRRNCSGTAVWQGDVRALDPRRVLESPGLAKGNISLLHGGPPCQPFSQIGHRKGLHDPRGRLAFEMVRFAETLRPSAVMLEQVPAFLNMQAADGMTVLDVMREEFRHTGIRNTRTRPQRP